MRVTSVGALAVAACLPLCSCTGGDEADPPPLTADVPLHLAAHVDRARLEGGVVPPVPESLEWSFAEPSVEWRPVVPLPGRGRPATVRTVDDALRLTLGPGNRAFAGRLLGGIYVDLGERDLVDWGHVEVRARTSDPMYRIGLEFNYTEADAGGPFPFYTTGDGAYLVTDGTTQTYRLALDRPPRRAWDGPWTHLAIWFNTRGDVSAATLDILSVRIVPRAAEYAAHSVGERLERRRVDGGGDAPPQRRALYVHAPGRLSYPVRLPERARLDVGLGVVGDGRPVQFRVSVTPEGGPATSVLDEVHDDARRWADHAVDLSRWAGQSVELALEADAGEEGGIALWATPTLSGPRPARRPNVILYVIDGGSPDYMSVYGYNRRTTPHLERIAAEGVVFEKAYSNSGWTRPSTPSFLTSLQHSVLGGLRNGRNPVPTNAPTLAERLHAAGYQTALLTSNSNAGALSDLQRGCDLFRDHGVPNYSASSVWLHDDFWSWRATFPAEPYFVHFQTTDVHNDHTPATPFAGLYVDPERRRVFEDRLERVNAVPESDEVRIREALDLLGIDPLEFWTAYRDLHDETMAHQDHMLGRLVERLKASGEWERTLLIVTADHGVAAGAWDYRLMMRDPPPEHVYHNDPGTPMLRPGVSRIPFVVVWPDGLRGGQRVGEAVSLIDLVPTILDLAGLPAAEVAMGQSLAPLMREGGAWEQRPVILDAFEVKGESRLSGRIEMVDGRWGASLLVNPDADAPPSRRRPAPLLLYDLWSDPDCLESLHDERPDLVEKYTRLLEEQLEAHQTLGRQFEAGGDSPLTPEQLETLRALGYVQ